MDTVEVLMKARELLSDPKRWTQNWCARTAVGEITDVFSDDAVSWCSFGAIRRSAGIDADVGCSLDAESTLCSALGHSCTARAAEWNDTTGRTHAEVLAAFDKAIAIASQESP